MKKCTDKDIVFLMQTRRAVSAINIAQTFLWGVTTGAMIGMGIQRHWKMAIGYCVVSMVCMYGAKKSKELKNQLTQQIKNANNNKKTR